MRIIVLLIIINAAFSCNKSIEFRYNYYQLQNAWANNDSQYLRLWVQNLEKEDFVSFANRVSEFANVTNFCYGYMDTEVGFESNWSDKEKDVIRFNVLRVNLLYIKSCLFLKKSTNFDSEIFIQEKYWNDSTKFNDNELRMIFEDMKSLCNLDN